MFGAQASGPQPQLGDGVGRQRHLGRGDERLDRVLVAAGGGVDRHQGFQRPRDHGLGLALAEHGLCGGQQAGGFAVQPGDELSPVVRVGLGVLGDLGGLGQRIEVAVGEGVDLEQGAAKRGLVALGGVGHLSLQVGEKLERGSVSCCEPERVAGRGLGGREVVAVVEVPAADLGVEVSGHGGGQPGDVGERFVERSEQRGPPVGDVGGLGERDQDVLVEQLAGPANVHRGLGRGGPGPRAGAGFDERALDRKVVGLPLGGAAERVDGSAGVGEVVLAYRGFATKQGRSTGGGVGQAARFFERGGGSAPVFALLGESHQLGFERDRVGVGGEGSSHRVEGRAHVAGLLLV